METQARVECTKIRTLVSYERSKPKPQPYGIGGRNALPPLRNTSVFSIVYPKTPTHGKYNIQYAYTKHTSRFIFCMDTTTQDLLHRTYTGDLATVKNSAADV